MNIFRTKLTGKDKLLHSFFGNIILVVFFLVFVFFMKWWKALAFAFFWVLSIGLSKELFDKKVKHTFIDWWDIVASITPYPIVKWINKEANG
jgi:hypothetical protein|uniref:Putative periplasmic lipoprotein n=1 Tax=Siphoviridae sp. ctnFV5 TaxID=2823600 RepID=A0A8S5L716_9CAUD|nr:MAG TPA: putative periplasmic lipoprotein [Siphoviridae sp. ctnFV5]